MDLSGKRILIVDDEEEIVEVMSYILEPSGATISSANDGLAGLEMIKSQPFDLIISDIRMPGIDGYQLITGVKKSEINRKTPIVVITGYLQEPEERAFRLGAVKVFIKPLRTMELLDWVTKRIQLSAIDVGKFQIALKSGAKEILEFYLQDPVTLVDLEETKNVTSPSLSGTIHFIGGDFRGYMKVTLDMEFIAVIGEKTFGDEYDEEFASEIVGELCNQCLGKVIQHFSEIDVNLSLDIGIPEVISVSEKKQHFFHDANYTVGCLVLWKNFHCSVELIMN